MDFKYFMFSNFYRNIITFQMFQGFCRFFLLNMLVLPACLHLSAQEPLSDPTEIADSLYISQDITADSIVTDSILVSGAPGKESDLEAPVNYSSFDSLSISIGEKKIYLYKTGSVEYQDMKLDADYIEFDMNTNTSLAAGMPDSTGEISGKPIFKQGMEEYDSDTMRYNFKSRKAYVKYIVTKQGEGFLHSQTSKRQSNGDIHVNKAMYTTCDAEHPHFYIALTKAIAIPNDKLLSGPAYMVLEDIPLPLALPFGFFPNTTSRSSGFIFPTYGEEAIRGFYLRNGGWYFAINDYIDFTMLGTIYSRGTWGLAASSTYKIRYKFSGNFNIDYFKNQLKDDPDNSSSRDFRVYWNHRQDAKANPSRTFSANVDFKSTSYNSNYSYDINEYLENTQNSSISYSKKWAGSPFNLSANLRHSQSSKTKKVNLTLPSVNFNMSRIYPFRSKNNTDGKFNWFENIQVSYTARLINKINSTDSTLFTSQTLNNMENGFAHDIPISLANIRILKDFINITPSVNYNGVLYTSYIQKRQVKENGYYTGELVNDTIHKITYANGFGASISISANPKIYGMYTSTSTDSYITAVRHVITPRISFSYSPDLGKIAPDYYRKVATSGSVTQPFTYQEYSIYENYPYGTPSIRGKSASLTLGLNNNLEMKVKQRTDSSLLEKKVSILDNLNFSASYNPYAKSFRWSTMNMTGSTRLFNSRMNINFGAVFDPYALDSAGKRINTYLIRQNGKLFRLTNANVNITMGFQSGGTRTQSRQENVPDEDLLDDKNNPTLDRLNESTANYNNDYVDFDIPWKINVNYSWSYSKTGLKKTYYHTIRLSGDMSLTAKWKIGMNTGYDFIRKKFSTTNISIHRDLHCWSMRFTVVPFGERRSYSFSISANSSILRDLKYNKSKSWYDNF